MENNTFWKGLGLATLAAAVLMAVLTGFLEPLRRYAVFSAVSIGLFVLLSLLLFFSAKSAAKSSSKLAFNNLILASVFGKLVFTLLVLFIYKKMAAPTDGLFAVLFMLVYAIFTGFEVRFMTRLAKA